MSKEQNKLIMYRMIEEIWNKGNLAAADEIFSADHFSPSAPDLPKGPESVKMLAGMFRAAMPDYHMNIDLIMSDETKVVARFTQSGTHTGAPLMGMEPSGRRAEWTEIGILEIHGGKVTQSWYEVDMLALIGQLNPSDQDTIEQNKDQIEHPKEQSMSSYEYNKEVTRRFSAEVWGEGKADLADELMAADLVEHTPFPGPIPGLAGHKQVLALFRAAFPDLNVVVDAVTADGDLTSLRWHGTGTHTGPLMGIPPTGKTVHITGMDMLRIEDGKIKERWAEVNTFSLMQQLGVIPGE